MTKAQILEREQAGLHMPYSFTGVWKGSHYYRGRLWLGPTNRVGQRRGKAIASWIQGGVETVVLT